jgi:hypothetical protein
VLFVVVPLALGGYGTTIHRIADAMSAQAPGSRSATENLNGRLFQLSGEGRVQMWTAALHQWETDPLVGQGSLQFAQYWVMHRPNPSQTVEAHSLYLQTLAELGVIGLVLLIAALCPPLIAGWRARSSPLAPVFLGAFVGFLVHNATDWDWSVPGVTLAGLACAVALMAATRGRSGRVYVLGSVARWAAGAAVVLVLMFSAYSLRVNIAVAASTSDAGTGNWHSAVSNAQTATKWAPWMEDAWVALGQARLGAGDNAAAASAFRHAISKNHQDWTAWYGLAQSTSGKVSDAALAKALAINPRDSTMRATLRERRQAARKAAARKRQEQRQAQRRAYNRALRRAQKQAQRAKPGTSLSGSGSSSG